MTLIERLTVLRDSKDERIDGLTPAQNAVADEAYLAVTEHAVPLFVDDATGIDMEKLQAVRVSLQFYVDLLTIVEDHPVEEANAVLLSGDPL